MRIPRVLSALTAAAALASPAVLSAQDQTAETPDLSEMTETLRDPDTQAEITTKMTALTQILLDLDLAPLAEMAESVSGEPLPELEQGGTLRELSPEAEALPEVLENELPKAMDKMADMGGAMEAMLPLLVTMAEQMREVVEDGAETVR